jgi:phosphoadenosine phosphosulfate reductase
VLILFCHEAFHFLGKYSMSGNLRHARLAMKPRPLDGEALTGLDLSVTAARLASECARLDLEQRVAVVRHEVSGRMVFTTSFGLEDQAIAHAIFAGDLAIDVVTLDTGRLFPETYELWTRTEARYGRRIRGFFPDRDSIERLIDHQGINGFRQSLEARYACCAVRKLEPLRRALCGAVAWLSGVRAEQSSLRAKMTYAAVDPQRCILKVNPLFDWTREQVLTFIGHHEVPHNPLHDRGFLSIGCAPCTRAVAPGESERAGRWWWEREDKKECGLHARHPALRPEPASA